MDAAAIAEALDQLTGSWAPEGAATATDLAEARQYLARALASGVAAGALHAVPDLRTPPPSGARPLIDAIAQRVQPEPAPMVVPYLRRATDIDPRIGAGAAGMAVSKTLGPFVDGFGVPHWIDLIPLPRKIPISSATRGILGYLITTAQTATTLGAGSVWVSVGALNVPAAPSGAVGVSFSGGTVKKTGAVTASPNGITIAAGGALSLTLTLAPPVPQPGNPAVGRDARQMTLALPAQVVVEFTAAGAAFVTIAPSSATVYGATVELKRNALKPRLVTIGLDWVLFPCDVSAAQFAFASVLSTDVVPSGAAPINAGGWALAITTAQASQLGNASSAGSLVLELGGGVTLQFGDLASPLGLARATLGLAPGVITIAATTGGRDVVDPLVLWDPAPTPPSVLPAPARHPSQIDFRIPRGGAVFAVETTTQEVAAAFGSARVSVDRPLGADGSRLGIAFGSAALAFIRTAAARRAYAVMSQATAGGRVAIALENGLVQASPPQAGVMSATYSGTRLAGTLALTFTDPQLLPTLPDPYAAANAAPVPLPASLFSVASWTLTPGAALRFLIGSASQAQVTAATGVAPVPADAARRAGGLASGTTLLDLSSNADQFGLSLGPAREAASVAAIDKMAVTMPLGQLTVYALPGISWEPVVDQTTNDWLDAPSSNDGPPVGLRAFPTSVTLVRTEPAALLPAFAQANGAYTFGQFTLPFGLIASLYTNPNTPQAKRPSYALIKASYPSGLDASRQLSIRATGTIAVGDPALPGSTTTGSPLPVPLTSTVYGVLTLGNDPLGAAQFFDQQFSASGVYPQIPVTRIDISGYGTSMFSDWKNDDFGTSDPVHGIVGVVRARFDVLVGRTSYELVQIATVIAPWCIRITRTIIFDRYDSGLVVRHDTGWKAVGNGEFALLGVDQRLLGAIVRLENIHNIAVGTGPAISFTSPDVHEPVPPSETPPSQPTPLRQIEFVPVTFDADVVMSPAVTASTNGSVAPAVAATQITGYAQRTVGQVASALEILGLMQRLPDGVAGSLGCIVNVGPAPSAGTPRFTLNVSALSVKVTSANVAGQGYPALAVALHGAPRLPRDGAWSITRRGKTDVAPTAVDPTFPLPLILGTNNDNNPQWRLLDPSDALSVRGPATVFGLIQGTGTSKSLFENPVVTTAGQALSLDPADGVPAPNLADIGALLGAVDIFPNLGNVLRIPTGAGDVLTLAQDGFARTFAWRIEQSPNTPIADQQLLDLGVVSLVLQYHGPDPAGHDAVTQATLTIDATAAPGSPRWAVQLQYLSFAVLVAGFGPDPLLTIHGDFSASETKKAGFDNIAVAYGSALSPVTNIISGLTTLVEAFGGAVDLDVGFSDNKLTVHDGFALPTLPLGLGQVEDIAIDLGVSITIPTDASFSVGLGSQDKPFTWIVDPLAGTGAIVLGTTGGNLGVYIEAGIGAALAIDLAVASGSASIVLELSISTNVSPLALTAALVGNASVDVLDGLASASLTLAAAITIVPLGIAPDHPLPNAVEFTGAAAVGIHISIAWVVSVDFDGSWALTETFPLHLP